MHIASLHIYPVKGLRAVDLSESAVEPRGLAHDRRWMIVDAAGKFLTQREYPKMARIEAFVTPAGLRLAVDGRTLEVKRPVAETKIPVNIWRQDVEAWAAGPEAAAFLSEFLGVPVRLVWQGDLKRPIVNQWAPPGTEASYADGYPLLVTTLASLEDLNRRMAGINNETTASPLPMNRFRPNLVIAGATSWAEDGWRRIRVGAAVFELVKPCLRCVVTTTDQQTGTVAGGEPLGTLKSFRMIRQPGLTGVAFGQNAVPAAAGIVRVGDAVEVLETQTPPAFVAVG